MDLISCWRAGMPVNENKKTKPGSFLRVLWKRDKATRANFAWGDSEDGIRGGKRRPVRSAHMCSNRIRADDRGPIRHLFVSQVQQKTRREREPAMHSDFSNMLAACPLSAPMRWDPLAWFL